MTKPKAATAATTPSIQCVLDRSILNEDTYPIFNEHIGLAIFAPLCGRNRGAFILDPPDGGTHGCASFPTPTFAERAGITDNPYIVDSNSISTQYLAGNITEAQAVNLVDLLIQSVYASSADDNDQNFMACDAGGLAKLECSSTTTTTTTALPTTIRAVTLAGVFVPAPWATGGRKDALTVDQVKTFYTAKDFADMHKAGLNAIQIPVPLSLFSTTSSDKDNNNSSRMELLGDLLQLANNAGLGAILVLVASDDTGVAIDNEAVETAAIYAASNKNILALTLPTADAAALGAARAASKTLPLFRPTLTYELPNLTVDDPYTFAALDRDHTTSVADIASSDSFNDRLKMFYHESTACSARSPIEYAACFRNTPAFVSNGFNMAIDDCIHEGLPDFKDYGQCGRFNEREHSNWWLVHRQSFAARQVAAFESGLGWSFATWKLYSDHHHHDDGAIGVLDTPFKMYSLRDVMAAGLMPSLTETPPALLACLNPPVADFVLGDDTLAPTPGPPPSCDGGWWSEELGRCDYWVPPPDPTPCPTLPPYPQMVEACNCDDYINATTTIFAMEGKSMNTTASPTAAPVVCPTALTRQAIGTSAAVGAAVVIVVGMVIRYFLPNRARSTNGYTAVPEGV